MKLLLSDEERRSVACALIAKLRDFTPGPLDLAALTVELAELGRESIAHCCDNDSGLPTRAELFAELDRVQQVARAASLATTEARRSQLVAARGAVS